MSDLLSIERAAFSERLKQRMAMTGLSPSGSTLAREFNSDSEKPISVQTAINWLHGRNIPTRPRLAVLAKRLNVTPEWLRMGSGAPEASSEAIALARQIEHLDERGKHLAKEMIRTLLRLKADSS